MTKILSNQIKGIRSHFDYKDILQQIQKKGQERLGHHFRLYKEDLPIIVPIVAWMLRDEDVAQQCQIDLNKGIFLSGPIGSGKTHLMQIMRCLTSPSYEYNVYSCPKIAFDFGKYGTEVISRYTYNSFHTKSNMPVVCCFDDLGKEINVQHYGTSCKVMQQILLARYDLFIEHGMITHATSSLYTTHLEERYGPDIRSRFREMFNKLSFHKNTQDKRKNYL